MTEAATNPGQPFFVLYDVSQRRLEGMTDHEERALCKSRRLRGREEGDLEEEERELCTLPPTMKATARKGGRRLQNGTVTAPQNAQVEFNGTLLGLILVCCWDGSTSPSERTWRTRP